LIDGTVVDVDADSDSGTRMVKRRGRRARSRGREEVKSTTPHANESPSHERSLSLVSGWSIIRAWKGCWPSLHLRGDAILN